MGWKAGRQDGGEGNTTQTLEHNGQARAVTVMSGAVSAVGAAWCKWIQTKQCAEETARMD